MAKVKVSSGGTNPIAGPGKTPLDATADVRDILSGLVGGGYTSLSDDTVRNNYTRLQSLVGPTQAQKLMTQMFIFNQNPTTQRLPPEARIKSFYDTPVGDEEVQTTLKKVKNFGYGVLPGFRESSSQLNQQLAGRLPNTVAVVDPAVQNVKVRVAKKLQ